MKKKEMISSIINEAKYYKERLYLMEFLLNNKHIYSKSEYDFLMDFIFLNKCFCKCSMPDIVVQLFSLFEIFNDGCDIYLEFTKILEQYDFLKGDVLEIGGGVFPRLAQIITPKIKINGGTLTVYDPRLGCSTTKDASFHRQIFTLDTDVSKFSTIIGMFPCEATTTIVEQTLNYDKNLLVACCDCDHSSTKYPRYNFGEYWADDYCAMLKDDYGDEIDIIKWPQALNCTLPIIVRKKSK